MDKTLVMQAWEPELECVLYVLVPAEARREHWIPGS